MDSKKIIFCSGKVVKAMQKQEEEYQKKRDFSKCDICGQQRGQCRCSGKYPGADIAL